MGCERAAAPHFPRPRTLTHDRAHELVLGDARGVKQALAHAARHAVVHRRGGSFSGGGGGLARDNVL